MPRRLRRALVLGVVLVIVLVGGAFAVFALRGGDAPPPPTLSEATATATAAPSDPEQATAYEVTSSGDTFVGYRVREEFAGFGVKDAVGRTPGSVSSNSSSRLSGRRGSSSTTSGSSRRASRAS